MAENEELPDQEQQATIFNEEELLNSGYDKHIRRARNVLFVVAGIQFFFMLVSLLITQESIDLFSIGIVVFTTSLFIGLGLWTRKKPFTAILIGLIFYCLLVLVDLVFEPVSVFRGLIFKIIVIVYLAKGLTDARQAQQTRQALGK